MMADTKNKDETKVGRFGIRFFRVDGVILHLQGSLISYDVLFLETRCG